MFIISIGWAVLFLVFAFGVGLAVCRYWDLDDGLVSTPVVWGAVVLIVGGLLMYPLSVPLVYWFFAWTVFGVIALVCYGPAEFKTLSRFECLKGVPHLLWIVIGIAVFWRAVSISSVVLNHADDEIAYMPFVLRMLYHGGLNEPFAFRGVGSYGGQLVLQAYASLPNIIYGYQTVEFFSFFLIWLLQLLEIKRLPTLNSTNHFLFLLIFVVLSIPSINHAPQASACVMIFALFRTLDNEKVRLSFRKALSVAMLLATICSFRGTLVAWCGIFWGLWFVQNLAFSSGNRLRSAGTVVISGIIMLLLLTPAILTMYYNFGTPLYPLMHGYENQSFNSFNQHWEASEYASSVYSVLGVRNIIALFVFSLLIAYRSPVVSILASMIFVSALLCFASVQVTSSDVYRYFHAPLIIAYIMGLCVLLRNEGDSEVYRELSAKARAFKERWRVDLLACAKAVVVILCLSFLLLSVEYPGKVFAIDVLKSRNDERYERRIEQQDVYKDLLEGVPAGSRVLVAVPYPYLIEPGDIKLWLFDIPGLMSPPCLTKALDFRNQEEVFSELNSCGIDYLLLTHASKGTGLYSEYHWKSILSRGFERGLPYLKVWSWKFRAYFDFIANLAKKGLFKAEEDGVLLIDVKQVLSVITANNAEKGSSGKG